MPSDEGRLTSEDLNRVKRWLVENEAIRPCPACAFNEWAVEEQLAMTPTFMSGGVFGFGAGFPAVAVVCKRCGYFRFHSAVMIGIVEKDAPAPTRPADAEEVKNGA
jgi:predicted nucleic-acid-binding Zn-ribbon protein